MSSPVHYATNLDAALMYAPPWARKTSAPAGAMADRLINSPPTSPDDEDGEPHFVGDREMRSLRRRLSLDPEIVPEPPRPIDSGVRIGRIALRLVALAAVAALVAWAAISLPMSLLESKIMQAAAAATALAATPSKLLHYRIAMETPAVQAAPQTLTAPAAMPTPPKLAVEPQVASAPRPQQARPPVAEQQGRVVQDAEKTLALSPDEIATLLKRGKDYLMNGDISSARLLLRRAAQGGSAAAALALGSTFDPVVLERLGAIGVGADPAKAREWYQKAAQFGSHLALAQLGNLGASGR